MASQEVSAANGWAWSFDISNGVPGTNANPVGVEFTVTENSVDKYILTDVVNPTVTFNDPAAGSGWDTIKPCSQLEISNRHDAKSIVVAKKGNTFLC